MIVANNLATSVSRSGDQSPVGCFGGQTQCILRAGKLCMHIPLTKEGLKYCWVSAIYSTDLSLTQLTIGWFVL